MGLLPISDVHGPAQSPEARVAQPQKPEPSPALVTALAGPRPGSRILQARAQPSSPGFQYFSMCLRGLRSLPSTINQRSSMPLHWPPVRYGCAVASEWTTFNHVTAMLCLQSRVLMCSTTSLLVTSPPPPCLACLTLPLKFPEYCLASCYNAWIADTTSHMPSQEWQTGSKHPLCSTAPEILYHV